MGSPPQRTVGKWGEDGWGGTKKRRRWSGARGKHPGTEQVPSMRWGWGCCGCWWSRCFPGWWGWSHPSSPSPSPSLPPSPPPSTPPSPWVDKPPRCPRRPWQRSGPSGAPAGQGPTLDALGKRSSTAGRKNRDATFKAVSPSPVVVPTPTTTTTTTLSFWFDPDFSVDNKSHVINGQRANNVLFMCALIQIIKQFKTCLLGDITS